MDTLSARQRKIVSLTQLRANASMEVLQELTGYPPHTIRRELVNLKKNRIIIKLPFIDIFKFGYLEAQLMFSVTTDRNQNDTRFLKYLSESWRVPWLATLGGEYQYGATICCSSHHDLVLFLDGLCDKLDVRFHKRIISSITYFKYFRKRYLDPSEPLQDIEWLGFDIRHTHQSDSLQADETDRLIVSELYRNSDRSHEAIANSVGLPRSTLEYRLRRLEDEKILLGFIYAVPPTAIGAATFKLLVSVQSLDADLEKGINEFCTEEVFITSLIRCMGSWDFECGIECFTPTDAFKVAQRLRSLLGSKLVDLQLIPVFQQIVPRNFLGSSSVHQT